MLGHLRRTKIATIGACATTVLLLTAVWTHADPPGFAGGMAKRKPINFKDRVVTFTTMDGVEIEADYYPVKVEKGKRTPVAILIHMHPTDRSSWKSFVPKLREYGIAVLAYDIRGAGGSVKPADKKLAEGYESKSAQFFQSAWFDVEAAKAWLEKQQNIDMSRCALVGASVGANIAIMDAAQSIGLAGVVALSPGLNYCGIDCIAQIKIDFPSPLLLIAPEGEYEVVTKLLEAAGRKIESRKYPGGAENHGTKMFDAEYGAKVQKRIMKFLAKQLRVTKIESDDEAEVKAGDGKKNGDEVKKNDGKKKKKKKHKKKNGKKKKKNKKKRKAPKD